MPTLCRLGALARAVARRGGGIVLGLASWALGGMASPETLAGQDSPLVVEARGGAAIPIRSFARGTDPGEGTSAGASFGADIALAGGGRWTPYVGFSQHRFGCEDAGCVAGGRYVATGFHGGARFLPFPSWPVLPWLGVGAVTTHVETGDLGGANAGLSKLGVGGEAAFGVHIGSASRVALNPAVRYVALSSELPGGATLDMRYLVADVAVALSF